MPEFTYFFFFIFFFGFITCREKQLLFESSQCRFRAPTCLGCGSDGQAAQQGVGCDLDLGRALPGFVGCWHLGVLVPPVSQDPTHWDSFFSFVSQYSQTCPKRPSVARQLCLRLPVLAGLLFYHTHLLSCFSPAFLILLGLPLRIAPSLQAWLWAATLTHSRKRQTKSACPMARLDGRLSQDLGCLCFSASDNW